MKDNKLAFYLCLMVFASGCSQHPSVVVEYVPPLKSAFHDDSLDPHGYTYLNGTDSLTTVELKAFEITTTTSQFKLFLIDADLNGCFNDYGVDQLGLANKNDSTFNEHPFYLQSLKKRHLLSIDEKLLYVDDFQCTEEFQLTPLDSSPQYVPDLILNTKANSKIELQQLFSSNHNTIMNLASDTTYTYVGFWGTWCAFCYKYLPFSDSIDALPNAKLVYVNFGDTSEKAREYVTTHKMKGIHYQAETTNQKELGITAFPGGIILNPNKEIVAMNILPTDALEFLITINNNYSKNEKDN